MSTAQWPIGDSIAPAVPPEAAPKLEPPPVFDPPSEQEGSYPPPTWEAAYLPEQSTSAARSASDHSMPTEPERCVETAAAPRAAELPAASPSVAGRSTVVELPSRQTTFDCSGLAAAIRRLRPSGGRLALISVGQDGSNSGVANWSADLVDELAGITARPVEQFASARLAIDGESVDAPLSDAYALYFVGAEFAARRGNLLRNLDAVLLVVAEGATTVKAAEVVRGALAAQGVAFAGLVYVAR
jgi:hypothetical protein